MKPFKGWSSERDFLMYEQQVRERDAKVIETYKAQQKKVPVKISAGMLFACFLITGGLLLMLLHFLGVLP